MTKLDIDLRADAKRACRARWRRSTGYAGRLLLCAHQCAAAVCLFLKGTWIAFEMARGKDGIRPDIHLR